MNMQQISSEVNNILMVEENCQNYSSRDKMAFADVYNNDYLMEKIIANLSTLHDRWKLDEVSLRFQDLVRETKWENATPSFKKLTVCALGDHVVVFLGNIRKYIRSEDFSNELNTILWKSLICKRHVEKVEYGSHGNQRLTFTRDLIVYLDNFNHLRSLDLKFYKTEPNAIEYLKSDQCHFKNRIENLSIKDMNYGPWISHVINRNLRTLSIRILVFSIASVLLQRLNELDLHLDTIDIEISASGFGDIGQQVEVINGFSKRCTNLNLTFSNNVKLATNIALWTNIRSLTIDTGSIQNLTELPIVLENLMYLKQLEKLKISERLNRAAFISLRKGVQDLKTLKYLNIFDNSPKKEYGIIEQFFEVLPLSLEEIQLDKFVWESEAIVKFSHRSLINLKKLTIRRPHEFGRQGSFLFDGLIDRFPSLEVFHFFDIINSDSVNHIFDHPNLKDVMISIRRDFSMDMVMAIQNKFNIIQSFPEWDCIGMHLRKK